MLSIALAVAAQLSMPAPVDARFHDIRAVFSAEDFPAYLKRDELTRTVYTRTTVGPDGGIQGCVAELSSGDPLLDAYTCGIILKRARFRPAKWTDSSPVYAVIRVPVTWASVPPRSEEDSLRATVPDLEITVNQLPKGAHSLVWTSVQVAADENGKPLSCSEFQTGSKRRFPELDAVACQEVMASFTVRPPHDASGKSVRSVQGVSVLFTRDH